MAQAVIECIHLALHDQLCTETFSLNKFREQLDTILQATAWAIHSTFPSNIPCSPSQMMFGIDMIFRQKANVG